MNRGDHTTLLLTTAFASECVTSALRASLLRSHQADSSLLWMPLSVLAPLVVGLTVARPSHAHLWHRLMSNLDLRLTSASRTHADAELRRLWLTPEFALAYLGYELAHPGAPSLYDFLPSIGVAVPASAPPLVEAMLDWGGSILCRAALVSAPQVPPPDWLTCDAQLAAVTMEVAMVGESTLVDHVTAIVAACLRSVSDAGGTDARGRIDAARRLETQLAVLGHLMVTMAGGVRATPERWYPAFTAARGLVHVGVALDRTCPNGAVASARRRAVRLAAWCAVNVNQRSSLPHPTSDFWFALVSNRVRHDLAYPVSYDQAVDAGDWRTLEWLGRAAHPSELSSSVRWSGPGRLMHAPAGHIPSTNRRARDRARASRTVLKFMLQSADGCCALISLLKHLPATPMRAEWLQGLALQRQQRAWIECSRLLHGRGRFYQCQHGWCKQAYFRCLPPPSLWIPRPGDARPGDVLE